MPKQLRSPIDYRWKTFSNLSRLIMKSLLTLLSTLLLLTNFLSAKQYLIISFAQDTPLMSFSIDPKTGVLKEHDKIDLPGEGGPLTITRNEKHLYVETRIKVPDQRRPANHLASVSINNGKFKHLNTVPSLYRSPSIYVDKTGTRLLSSHYGEGKVTTWEIGEDHKLTGKNLQDITTAPRSHFIISDPSNRFVYVPHTSPNAVYQFGLKDGQLTALCPEKAEGPDVDHRYHEPRHLAFHPTLDKVYTSNERGGGVSLWNQDLKTGKLTLEQTLCTLPKDYPEKGGAAADIQVTPNGKFVYVSNRDYSKRPKDDSPQSTIAGFKIDQKSGKLSPIGIFPTEHAPRSFCIDKTGNFLFVGGQHTNKLASYRIDSKSGKLSHLKTIDTAKAPIWLETIGQ